MKGLREYQKKRDFSKTAEPQPGRSKSPAGSAQSIFVIQKHAASHLHYDFRLEINGALKSWAIPKGIPFAQGEKHLAVHVEDHPLDYARFEGTIPKGSYGGGTVMVWDIGEYAVSGSDPLAAYRSGKLHLLLHGKKIHGEWTLVRSGYRQPGKENWLLIKTGDSVRPVSSRKDDESAVSGKTMQQISEKSEVPTKAEGTVAAVGSRPKERSRRGSQHPEFVPPMKVKLVKTLPKEPGWIFEMKFDGYRAILIKDGGNVTLYSRNQKKLSFPELAKTVASVPCQSGVFDGEIVALDERGHPSFQLLQARERGESSKAPICLYLFDLLHLDGVDLQNRPLSERKNLLAALISKSDPALRYSGELPGTPDEILSQIKALGIEGVVAKRKDSRYEPGQRSGKWIKVKCINEQEFVIGGYTLPKGSRSHFGSVLVGYYEGGKLRFAGKVGAGFNERMLAAYMRDFKTLRSDACPFVDIHTPAVLSAAELRNCRWVKPERVCQVGFTEWTRDGKLRQPVFLGIRTDKLPSAVIREDR